MAITASDVKKLREATGAGMMECKKALVATDNNFDAAVKSLRERGLSAAKKKAGRTTAEGLIVIKELGKQAIVVEVNCETDFVGKNEQFVALVNDLAGEVESTDAEDVAGILDGKSRSNSEKTVQQLVNDAIASIGENLTFRRFEKISIEGNGFLGNYVHGAGKIGTVVNFKTEADLTENEEFKALTRDIAMHVTAAAPQFLQSSEVSQAHLDDEKEIYRKQLLDQGKPAEMIDKILIGKMKKYYSEVCLLDQNYVKEDKKSITQVLKEAEKKFATTIAITGYLRWQLGEGIEKKADNFAEEVASMTT